MISPPRPRIPTVPAFEPFPPLGPQQELSVALVLIPLWVVASASPRDSCVSPYQTHHDLPASPGSQIISHLPHLSGRHGRTLPWRQAWPGTRRHIPRHEIWLLQQLPKGASGNRRQEKARQLASSIASSLQSMDSPHNLSREFLLSWAGSPDASLWLVVKQWPSRWQWPITMPCLPSFPAFLPFSLTLTALGLYLPNKHQYLISTPGSHF